MLHFTGYFGAAAIVIGLGIAFRTLDAKARSERAPGDRMHFTVCAPLLYRIFGAIGTLFFGWLITLFFRDRFPAFGSTGSVLFFVLLLAALGLCLYRWWHRKLVVRGKELVLTPALGRKRTFCVAEVTHILADGKRGIRAYTEKKKLFSVSSVYKGSTLLVSYFIENGVRAPERIDLTRRFI